MFYCKVVSGDLRDLCGWWDNLNEFVWNDPRILCFFLSNRSWCFTFYDIFREGKSLHLFNSIVNESILREAGVVENYNFCHSIFLFEYLSLSLVWSNIVPKVFEFLPEKLFSIRVWESCCDKLKWWWNTLLYAHLFSDSIYPFVSDYWHGKLGMSLIEKSDKTALLQFGENQVT